MRVFTKALLTAALFAVAVPAMADRANLDRAMVAAFKSYHEGGVQQLYQDASMCTTGVDFNSPTESPEKQSEYCMAFEYTGFLILDHEGELGDAQYFSSVGVLLRADQNLERAAVISTPEQLNAYFVPRLGYVKKKVLTRLDDTRKSVGQNASASVQSPSGSNRLSTTKHVSAKAISSDGPAVRRCGWISNTMPSNLGLTDRDGTWTIANISEEADGIEHMPNTDKGDSWGCLTVETNRQSMRITKVLGGNLIPIARCERDKSIKSLSAE